MSARLRASLLRATVALVTIVVAAGTGAVLGQAVTAPPAAVAATATAPPKPAPSPAAPPAPGLAATTAALALDPEARCVLDPEAPAGARLARCTLPAAGGTVELYGGGRAATQRIQAAATASGAAGNVWASATPTAGGRYLVVETPGAQPWTAHADRLERTTTALDALQDGPAPGRVA